MEILSPIHIPGGKKGTEILRLANDIRPKGYTITIYYLGNPAIRIPSGISSYGEAKYDPAVLIAPKTCWFRKTLFGKSVFGFDINPYEVYTEILFDYSRHSYGIEGLLFRKTPLSRLAKSAKKKDKNAMNKFESDFRKALGIIEI